MVVFSDVSHSRVSVWRSPHLFMTTPLILTRKANEAVKLAASHRRILGPGFLIFLGGENKRSSILGTGRKNVRLSRCVLD